jgi:hypothetical protein
MVEEMQRSVAGFRLDDERRLAVRGGEFGKVVDTVRLPAGEVWGDRLAGRQQGPLVARE